MTTSKKKKRQLSVEATWEKEVRTYVDITKEEQVKKEEEEGMK